MRHAVLGQFGRLCIIIPSPDGCDILSNGVAIDLDMIAELGVYDLSTREKAEAFIAKWLDDLSFQLHKGRIAYQIDQSMCAPDEGVEWTPPEGVEP